VGVGGGGTNKRRQIKNSVAFVRERTIPTERPPPVGEVSANFVITTATENIAVFRIQRARLPYLYRYISQEDKK
jgi:hypothetical protein